MRLFCLEAWLSDMTCTEYEIVMTIRFDLSFISEVGNRATNEDRYIIKQNFPVSNHLQGSLFCVIDG